jgi:thioredoxin reductase
LHSEASTLFKSSKITTDDRKISSYTLIGSGPGMKINFEDGTSKEEGFCVGQPKMELRSKELAEQLGVEVGEGGDEVKVSQPFFETNVKGVFAAGDAATPMKSALQAIYMGGFSGAGMVFNLGAEAEERGEL